MCMVRNSSLGSTMAELCGGRNLLPLVAGDAAIGKQSEFAALVETTAGLSCVQVQVGRGDAEVRELANDESFGGDPLAVLEDGEGALIDDGDWLVDRRLTAGGPQTR